MTKILTGQPKAKLTLVNLEKLVELWVEHHDKIAESDKVLLPLKPVYYVAPAD